MVTACSLALVVPPGSAADTNPATAGIATEAKEAGSGKGTDKEKGNGPNSKNNTDNGQASQNDNDSGKDDDNGAHAVVEIPATIKVERDLVYKQVDGEKLAFDFIQSKTKHSQAAPLLIHIHGGGWRGGDKSSFYRHLFFTPSQPLIERGLKVATINYRLAKNGGPTTAASVADCKDALRFFAKNAKLFGIDPRRIALMGGSAGGHLTLMTALAPDSEYPPGHPDLAEKLPPLLAAIPFYPLCHFGDPVIMGETLYGEPGKFTPMLGGPWEDNEGLARKLSPIFLLDKNAPPIFLLHGDADTVLPSLSSRLFVEKGHAIGADVKYLEVKNGNHGFRTADTPNLDAIIKQVTAYLDEHLMK
jgi:acetyl esterase/lipase